MFDLIDDYAGVVAYTSYDTAAFSNAGLLEKTGGNAVSAIYATVTNTGSIAVASGTLGFYGGGSFGGSISGAGTVAFTGGTSTLSATTTSANLLVSGGKARGRDARNDLRKPVLEDERHDYRGQREDSEADRHHQLR